jgi:hypothetical protein
VDRRVEQRRFSLINGAVLPLWIAMIAAPRSRRTAWMVDRSDLVLIGLSASYAVHLAPALTSSLDLTDARSVRGAMGTPSIFLAGWTHFAAFDLFVGRWIWETALREERSCRLALICTMMAGPTGLAIFSAQRRLRPAAASRDGGIGTGEVTG